MHLVVYFHSTSPVTSQQQLTRTMRSIATYHVRVPRSGTRSEIGQAHVAAAVVERVDDDDDESVDDACMPP